MRLSGGVPSGIVGSQAVAGALKHPKGSRGLECRWASARVRTKIVLEDNLP